MAFITDIENVELDTRIKLLISYLSVLQEGRTKPDNNAGGYIRESLYNINEIVHVKNEINKLFQINTSTKIPVDILEPSISNFKKLSRNE